MSNKWDDPEYRSSYFKAYNKARKEKQKDYMKNYIELNSVKLKAAQLIYLATHREAAKIRAKKWYINNKERASLSKKIKYNPIARKEYNKQYRINNIEKIRAYQRTPEQIEAHKISTKKWHERNREKILLKVTKWQKENPDKVRIHRKNISGRRRARIKSLPFEKIDAIEVYDSSLGICGICKTAVSITDFEIDHILPIAKGGGHTRSNTQIAHRLCNKRKGSNIQ